jgi:hypothetical protein
MEEWGSRIACEHASFRALSSQPVWVKTHYLMLASSSQFLVLWPKQQGGVRARKEKANCPIARSLAKTEAPRGVVYRRGLKARLRGLEKRSIHWYLR